MARKSRKPENQGEPVSFDYLVTRAAGYARLSVEDLDKAGNSIETQRLIIQNYAAEHAELVLMDIYVDDGKSGGTTNRPAFKKMLADVERKKINCIIVKDFSRFSRDLIDAGYYIEKFFPLNGIRFISISDGYDSADKDDSKGTLWAFKFAVNEIYALDIGKKVKSVWALYMSEGRYVGGRPPYGYAKAPDNRYQLVIDLQVASTVRKIFKLAADGQTASAIARFLNISKIPTPSMYHLQNEMIDSASPVSRFWHAGTVNRILKNEVYKGNLAQGKTITMGRKQRPVEPDSWIRTENTHEAIISDELYERVQNISRKTTFEPPKLTSVSYTPNLFKGKIYCACCGQRLERKKNH